MRLPVRRESNAGSQPLQPAARLCFALIVTTVNFSARIEQESERKVKERRRKESGGREKEDYYSYYLFQIKINYTIMLQ